MDNGVAHNVALCLDCNYPLHGLPDSRCPEGGRPFDLANSQSFNSSRPLNWLDRALLSPPGPITVTVVSLPCAILLWISLNPSIYYMGGYIILTILLWIIVAALLGIRWLLRMTVPPRFITRSREHRLRYVWLLVLVTSLLIFFYVPLRIAFLFARPDLNQLVFDIRVGKATVPVPVRRVGPYVIQSSRWYGGNDTLFFEFVDNPGSGFAFCPTPGVGPAGHYNEGTDGHLGGSWYWWTDD